MDVVGQSSKVVHKICRACLSGDEPFLEIYTNEFTDMDEKITLCDMLLSVAYIEVKTHFVPNRNIRVIYRYLTYFKMYLNVYQDCTEEKRPRFLSIVNG